MATLRSESPSATRTVLDNGDICAVVVTSPWDTEAYRGLRFDWAGQVLQVERDGVPYLGGFQTSQAHDTFQGIVEEFDIRGPQTYITESEGVPFLKLGVGWLIGDEQPYRFFQNYLRAELPDWKVNITPEENRVVFQQRWAQEKGIDLTYEKEVSLDGNKPVLRIRRTLHNQGVDPYTTHFYSHHMLKPGKEPIFPGVRVEFGLKPMKHEGTREKGSWNLDGNTFSLTGPVDGPVYADLEGQAPVQNNRAEVIQTTTGNRVSFTTDLPVVDVDIFYSSGGVAPELFSTIVVKPGKQITWTTVYRFD